MSSRWIGQAESRQGKPGWSRSRIMRRLLPARVAEWIGAIRKVRAAYRIAHGRAPRLLRPVAYSEKMQWRKLFELEPLFVVFSDKLASRDYIAAHGAGYLLVPLLWVGSDPLAIPFDRLQPPYAVKSSHASGHVMLVHDAASLDRQAIRDAAAAWLGECHATRMAEPGYKPVPRRIIVEAMVRASGGARPVERRVFVFGGRVRLIQTVANGAGGAMQHGAFHTLPWEREPWRLRSPPHPGPFGRPATLDEMVSIAERLGAGLSHLRVDFYDCGDRLSVGELTVYSWSGLIGFNPPEADAIVGAFWPLPRPMLHAARTLLASRYGAFRKPSGLTEA